MEQNNNVKERKKRLKAPPDLSSLVYGKVPPQARELEEAILGAIMLEKGTFDTAIEYLKPECFYVDAHQRIFKVMQLLQNSNQPIDILTVVEYLRKRDELEAVGGAYYISRLTNAVVSSAHIEAHSRILVQKFIQRELIRMSSEVMGDAYEDSTDAFELLDEAEQKLFEITNSYVKKNYSDIGGELVKTMKRIEDLRHKTDDISGVHSGFTHLDKVTNGFQPTDLIIIAARPSVGKTAFALNLARNAAMHPTRPVGVGFFSLEMGNGQLVQRILSAQSEVMMDKISRGHLADHEMQQLYTKGLQALNNAPLYLDDTASLNIFELRAKCRRMVSQHKVGMIIIDYLQLMSGSGENRNMNREQEISGISRALKGLAKELNIPIIALSQLNRSVEGRKEGNKVPQLSDLRESGAIEQDADMVMFLYRPDYYDINQNENGESNKGETYVKIAKHRNGSLDTITLKGMLHIQKFVDFEEAKIDFGAGQTAAHFSSKIAANDPVASGATNYIKMESKMNNMEGFDEGFDEEALF